MEGSSTSVLTSARRQPGSSSASLSSRRRKGAAPSAAPWLRAAATPRFSSFRRTSTGTPGGNCGSEAEALSTTTTDVGTEGSATDEATAVVRSGPSFHVRTTTSTAGSAATPGRRLNAVGVASPGASTRVRGAGESPPNAWSGDVEHPLKGHSTPFGSCRVHLDLVDHLAAHERLHTPGQMGRIDAEHRGAGTHERIQRHDRLVRVVGGQAGHHVDLGA